MSAFFWSIERLTPLLMDDESELELSGAEKDERRARKARFEFSALFFLSIFSSLKKTDGPPQRGLYAVSSVSIFADTTIF